jgi:hypothetical protein
MNRRLALGRLMNRRLALGRLMNRRLALGRLMNQPLRRETRRYADTPTNFVDRRDKNFLRYQGTRRSSRLRKK